MENDVVLSDEVYKLGVLRLPPLFPRLWKKFLCIGNIADRSIEPHVENLSFRALYRHRNTPVEVTAHRTWLKSAVDPALALTIDIASPLLVSVKDPL